MITGLIGGNLPRAARGVTPESHTEHDPYDPAVFFVDSSGGWDSDIAEKDGWCLAEAAGSVSNVGGKRPYQLQKLDDMTCFSTDLEAWVHVAAQRKARLPDQRNIYYQAVEFLKHNSPLEYAEMALRCDLSDTCGE